MTAYHLNDLLHDMSESELASYIADMLSQPHHLVTVQRCNHDMVFNLTTPQRSIAKPYPLYMTFRDAMNDFRILVDCFAPPPGVSAGEKKDGGKLRYDLLPPRAMAAFVGVLTFGAEKYAPDNWRKVEGWKWRYHAAALRHIFAWARGEKADPESGLPHLAHAMCCLAFILDLEEENEHAAT